MPEAIEKTLSSSSIAKAAEDFSDGKVHGVGINTDPMYYVIEYVSGSGTERVMKYTPGDIPRVEHWCDAMMSDGPARSCRHLAYGYMLEQRQGLAPSNRVISVAQEPAEVFYSRDISADIIGRKGVFTKAVFKVKREAEAPKPVEHKETPLEVFDFTDPVVFEVCDYLRREGIPSNLIKKVLANRRKDNPPKPERLYHGRQTIHFGLVAALLNKNIVFWGHKSTGKDTLVRTLCWCLGAEPIMTSGYSEITNKDDLLYSREAEGKGDGSFRTYKELGVLPLAMQQGKILVINEAAAIKPEVLISINPATDNQRRLYIPGHGIVEAEKGFFVIYLTNTGYEGLFGTNESTFDRTAAWETTYDPEALKNILDDMLPDDKPLVRKLTKLFDDLQEATTKKRLDSSRGISFRGIIDAVDMYKMGDGDFPIADCLRAGISNKIMEPKEFSEDRKTIDTIIASIFGGAV